MATFRSKMCKLDPDWADKIWHAVKNGNNRGPRPGGPKYEEWILAGKPSKPSRWALPLAALAVTGVRPASLETGITFRIVEDAGIKFVEATAAGAKIIKNEDGSAFRGQDETKLRWRLTQPAEPSHRPAEFKMICQALLNAPNYEIIVTYDAEAISTRLREVSQKVWPRRKTHVSGVCYRELLASTSKAAGVSAAELAMAMGHFSTESQGKYDRAKKQLGEA